MKFGLLLAVWMLSLDVLACSEKRFEFVKFDSKVGRLGNLNGDLSVEVAGFENPLFSPSPCFGGIFIIIRSSEIDKKLYSFEVNSKFYVVEHPADRSDGAYRGHVVDDEMGFRFPLNIGSASEEKVISMKVTEFALDGEKRAVAEVVFSLK